MYKPSIFFVLFVCFLSVCSSLTLEDFGETHFYESSQFGFWPMPGANIQNNGYSDMAQLEFDSATPHQIINNDQGTTVSPPIMDRSGYVYSIRRTHYNTSITYLCSIDCYDPAHNDKQLWRVQIPNAPKCNQGLIAFNSDNSFFAIVDGSIYLYTLTNDTSVPHPVPPYPLGFNPTLLIPLNDHYFLADDSATKDLVIVHYSFESNCTNSSSNSNCSNSGLPHYDPYYTSFKSDASRSPAAHYVQSIASATGLQDAPTLTLFSVEDSVLTAVNVDTRQATWTLTLPTYERFMSNVVVANAAGAPAYVFVLVVVNANTSQIVLRGYDVVSGEPKFSQFLFGPGGEERTPGRLSVNIPRHTIVAAIESVPGNDTLVYAYNYLNRTLMNVDLKEANFQGPISVDFEGRYYVLTSQYSGYLVLSSTDLQQVDRVLNTTGGLLDGVQRNYAALGNGSLIVTGSNGAIGFGPVSQPNSSHSSGGSDHRTVIILLCIFGGLVLIVLILALAGLVYHYYNKNKRQGYEQI